MNKKLGIVTFHNALSYGAILQSYALQNFLFDNNIDNEIINYTCKSMVKKYQKVFRPIQNNIITGTGYNLLTAPGIIKEKKTRDSFIKKHLVLSQKYNSKTIKDAKDNYRAFITGSDQVWSPTCVDFDPVYFLTFADSRQKYSYAASIATKKIPENLESEFKSRLSDFQHYSLREPSGITIINNLLGKNGDVHIDPTLLLTKERWDSLASEKIVNEPYIFLFTVLKPYKLIDYAIKLHKETGYKIIYLNKLQAKKYCGVEYMDPVTADKFISLIKNAEYVCTNSFHGSAFSIIYNKNFVCETKTSYSENIRSKEFMTKIGLENRILNEDLSNDINTKSNWDYVEDILQQEREKSRLYLTSI